VMNTPTGNTLSTAEHAFALMLALSRNVAAANQSLVEGRWDRKKFMGSQLATKTLGIVGLGRIGREVVNAGEPGELSAEGRKRLPRVLDRVRPDLLILCHGGNDILRDRDPRRVADNLEAMVKLARERGIDVLLVGVPERTLVFHDTADFYHEVAEATGVPLEADALADIVGDPALKSDAVHPNADGYRKLAIAIEERLREAGAL